LAHANGHAASAGAGTRAAPGYCLRAFYTATGAELAKGKLPAGGHFGMPQEPNGDYLVAFALPQKSGTNRTEEPA
jgi:hypothetical protein